MESEVINYMIAFLVASIFSFVFYLLLTTASGNLFLWSKEELIFGAIFGVIVGALVKNLFFKRNLRALNPKRFFLFLFYLVGPWFKALCIANIDVAYRVITGKINPGIVRVSPKLKTDLGITMLSTSLTLTPGTITVDIDEETGDFFVHWINVNEEILKKMPRDYQPLLGSLPDWARRLAE
jgi:multicomponent Na+:H+ antiporter subunit E